MCAQVALWHAAAQQQLLDFFKPRETKRRARKSGAVALSYAGEQERQPEEQEAQQHEQPEGHGIELNERQGEREKQQQDEQNEQQERQSSKQHEQEEREKQQQGKQQLGEQPHHSHHHQQQQSEQPQLQYSQQQQQQQGEQQQGEQQQGEQQLGEQQQPASHSRAPVGSPLALASKDTHDPPPAPGPASPAVPTTHKLPTTTTATTTATTTNTAAVTAAAAQPSHAQGDVMAEEARASWPSLPLLSQAPAQTAALSQAPFALASALPPSQPTGTPPCTSQVGGNRVCFLIRHLACGIGALFFCPFVLITALMYCSKTPAHLTD